MSERNFTVNLTPVFIIHGMIGAKLGTGHVSAQLNSIPRLDSHGYEVPSITIDWLVKLHGQPDVIYMDVAGFEGEALKAAETAFEATPDWCIQLHGTEVLAKYKTNNAIIVREFLHRGYKVFIIDGNKKARAVVSALHLPHGHCQMVATKTS